MKAQIDAFFKNCREGNLEAVKAALAVNGAFALAKDEHGNTALHHVCDSDYPTMEPNRLGEIRDNKLQIIRELLAKGAEIDAVNLHSETPFLVSVKKGYKQIPNLLIENNADVTIPNSDGVTALDIESKRYESYGDGFATAIKKRESGILIENIKKRCKPLENNRNVVGDNNLHSADDAEEEASQLQQFLSFVSSHKIPITLCVVAIVVCFYNRSAILSIGSRVLNGMLSLDKEAVSRVM